MARFRILAIDGGGIRGAIPAAFLARLEAISRKRTVDHFDLLAGTSTGGIIALGLAAGVPAQEILDFYRVDGPRIFRVPRIPVFRGPQRFFKRLVGALSDEGALHGALTKCFGARTMGDLTHRVMVPAFDGGVGDIRLIKSGYLPNQHVDPARSLVEAAMATSAAPTYLPGHRTAQGERLLDGGLWANCPAAIAVIEAVGRLGVPLDSIEVLSLGTGASPYTYPRGAIRAGILRFALGEAKDAVMVAQAAGALASVRSLLGNSERITRLSPMLPEGLTAMDDADSVGDLIHLGNVQAQHQATQVLQRFFDEPVSPMSVGRVTQD